MAEEPGKVRGGTGDGGSGEAAGAVDVGVRAGADAVEDLVLGLVGYDLRSESSPEFGSVRVESDLREGTVARGSGKGFGSRTIAGDAVGGGGEVGEDGGGVGGSRDRERERGEVGNERRRKERGKRGKEIRETLRDLRV